MGCCGYIGPVYVYSCSGATAEGETAGKIASYLADVGIGRKFCISLLAAGSMGMINAAKRADLSIVVNGCQSECAARILEKEGISYLSFNVTDYGIEKGEKSIDDRLAVLIAEKIKCDYLKKIKC